MVEQNALMELRDHPLMVYRSIRNWPPIWTKKSRPITLRGEIGTLNRVVLTRIEPPKKCFLFIDFNGESYTGTLIFDDASFCRQISDLLRQHSGKSIKDIGDLDLSFTL